MAKIYNGRVHAKMHALKLKSFKSRSFVITLLNKLNHIHVNSTSGHIYLFLTKKKKKSSYLLLIKSIQNQIYQKARLLNDFPSITILCRLTNMHECIEDW